MLVMNLTPVSSFWLTEDEGDPKTGKNKFKNMEYDFNFLSYRCSAGQASARTRRRGKRLAFGKNAYSNQIFVAAVPHAKRMWLRAASQKRARRAVEWIKESGFEIRSAVVSSGTNAYQTSVISNVVRARAFYECYQKSGSIPLTFYLHWAAWGTKELCRICKKIITELI